VPLEELNRSLVLLRSFTSLESAEIPPPARFWIFLARIKTELAGCEFANHKHSRLAFFLYYRASGEPKRVLVSFTLKTGDIRNAGI
jgi:hypothetical protein